MIGLAASPLRRCCRALAVAVAATPLAGCSGSAVVNALTPRSGYTVERDLSYGPNARQRLDLYVPEGAAADAPVLVFFYGGNWQSGSKELYRFVGQAFASRGYVTAIPDYRALPGGPLPDVHRGWGARDQLAAGATGHGRRAQAVRGRPFRRRLYRGDAGARPALARWRVGPGLRAHRGHGRARRALRLPAAARPRAQGGLRPRAGEPGFAADQPCERRRSADAAGHRHRRTAPCARATASPWPSA